VTQVRDILLAFNLSSAAPGSRSGEYFNATGRSGFFFGQGKAVAE
jgi:hypothetical protein